MTTQQQNAIELAKKLKALAGHQTAQGNEKANAEKLLIETLERHGLTLADLEDDKIEPYLFRVNSDHERRFLIQVFASVVGGDGLREKWRVLKLNRRQYKLKPTDIIVEIKCVKHEKILLFERWSFFWHHYQNEFELFYSAFIQKNELYANPKRTTHSKSDDVDWDEIRRLERMMRGIEKKTMIKTIDATAGDSEKKF